MVVESCEDREGVRSDANVPGAFEIGENSGAKMCVGVGVDR